MRAVAGLVTVLCIALCSAGDAVAQTRSAQEHLDEGGKLYIEGDYAGAIIEFKKGHALIREPIFLYNIALCYWRLGDYRRALSELDAALIEGGLGAQTETKGRARGHAFRVRLLSESLTEVSEPASVTLEGRGESGEAPVDGTGRSRALAWVGLGALVAGGGALVGFGIVELGLSDDVAAFKEAVRSGDTATADELDASIAPRQAAGRVLLYSGVGLAAVGATLLVFDLARADRPAVAFGVSENHVGLTWSMQF